ncbi:amino acid adenylation domain-containing protein [Streptomyces sp. TRM 70351]|uniref:amino acid adenylation domain-containing protein n=1 Tax=Streptomyces sp. TRM 70351 TaxID=3116552 RepID=UPI002E7B960C|nr:amino acid adenylation domain-containing protein [Streptomyces sp. TRM 70351]MEE1928325.1 amino acid adenylation domain-containing protein [Streptomyces sp. TRM 70351]
MSLHEESLREDGHRPLSGAQEGLWYAGRLASDHAAYNTAEAVEIHGALDTGLFETALRRTVAEADTFALRFLDTDDGPRCHRAPDADAWPLRRIDVSDAEDPEDAAWERVRADLATPAAPDREPLFAHTLLTLAPDRHLWLLRAHHILLDGYSYKLLGRRLADTYNALARGREPAPTAFASVTRLQQEEAAYLASGRRTRDRTYWSRRLAGLPEPARLTHRTAAPVAPFLRRTAELESADVRALSQAAARLDVSRTDLLTATVAAYLHRMTGAGDLVLGMATMSRLGSAALRTPGTASDVLPLRVAAEPGTAVADLVRAVAGDVRLLRRHQQYRGESIRRDLNLLGTGRRLYGPVLNIVPFTESLDFGGHPATWHHLSGGAVDDLQITVRPGSGAGGLWLAFDANPALYDEDELALHRDRFLHLLRRMAQAGPTTPVGDLDLLLPDEHPRDAPVRDFPVTGTLTDLFERQVRARPERVAVTCEGERLTYAELDARANRLARLLAERGAAPGRVVALALPRGPRLLPALLAVLKTGAAYLPLDPGHPAERLRLVMDDAAPVLLVTETGSRPHPAGDVPALVLDDPAVAADLAARPAGELTGPERPGPRSPSDTAYIIHTSGSTGRPKGVPVTHAAVVRLFAATAEHFDVGEDDVWTLFHSYAFDFSVWEMWGALLHGGRLVVVPHAVSRSPRDVLRLLHREGVTVLSQTPSAFEQLMDADAEQEREGAPDATGTLRYVVFGGEALRPGRLRPWAERHGLERPALVNMYGITETTVHVTHHRVTPADLTDPRRTSVIGRPLADLRVHLLDPAGRPVPPGAVGEMHVAGAGVAAGYLGRPELTAERFPDDPFGPPGARMYRSGDLARRRADGTLEYLGRADQQVQLRGFRVEPGEIEAVLTAHPQVSRAAVVVRGSGDDVRQLVAYTVSAGQVPPSPAELRAHAAAHLPDHMVPAACVGVDALPLTANGKLDTDALPAPDFAAAAAGARPRNPRQALLCALFEDVLRLPRDTVGTDANFFDLGGDSLLATRLLARLRHETGAEVPITALFDGPTPALLARQLPDGPGTAPARPVLGAGSRPERVPLSYAQERMWFLHRLDEAAATYNIPLVVPLGSGVDAEALHAALGDLADRHESLRTVFAERDGVPHQRVLPRGEPRPPLRRVDCPAEEIAAHVTAASRHRFDLAAETPLAAWLFGTGEERTLLLVLHHSAADGWSLRPLADDLAAAYAARRAGRAPAWEPLPVQYADYAVWQRALLAAAPDGGDRDGADPDGAKPDGAGRLERLTAHWRATLAGLPEECTVPGDRPRPASPRGGGAHVTQTADAALHRDLLHLAEAEGASLFMVLHAAVSALLTRCGAGEDVVVGTPVAGRSEPALDDLIGLLTNTLVLRADTCGDPAFRELLGRLRPHDLAALDHQDLPFDRLVDELNPPRRPGRRPLFQVMLALQNNEPAVLRLADRAVPLRPTATGTAKFDLFVDVLERHGGDGTPDGLDLHVEYATDLYDAPTAEEFARCLRDLLHAVCADPDRRIGSLPAPPPRTPATHRGTGAAEVAGMAEAALSVPGIRDAVALPGTGGAPPHLYVVEGRADAAEGAERALAEAGHDAVHVTAVNALPRTADGALDTGALRALPRVDRAAAAVWRRRLAGVPGVRTAEAGPEAAPAELGRRHAGPPRRAGRTAPADGPGTATGTVPALSEGPKLPAPAVSGWAQALARAAERGQGGIVHVHADGSETRRGYAALLAEASRVLAGLRRAGLRPGDQVILQCDASEDFLAVLWGCVLGGFVAVPLTVPASYATSSAALTKLEGIWRMLGRPWMVCSPAAESGLRDAAARQNWDGLRLTTADALREAPEDRDWYAAGPDDLLLMLMTSGSTGLPKAVRLTHRNVLTRSAATEAMNRLGARDVSLNWIPLDHVTGVVMFHLRDVYLGCRQVHAPTSWVLADPTRWMDLAHRHRVTVTWAPNFAFGLLAAQAGRFRDREWDLTPMRLVMNAGEVVVAADARRFLHTLKPFGLPQDVMHPGWGMSETCSVVTDTVLPSEPPGTEGTFVSCGRPYPGFAMRTVDERGTVLAEGDVGRLQVRGTSVTGGYHDNPAANAEAFTDDGWFDTGDLAFLRDGELYITGRAKDVIIVNGVNHYSHEIEACVEELPCAVRSFTAACAVRSGPSAATDELALFVHLAPGHDRATALREIAGKVTREIGVSPAHLVPVAADDIPKTEIGKIQRTKLRKSFEAGAFDEEVRAAQLLLGTADTLPDWFLRPVWQRSARHRPGAAAPGRHTLVLAGGDPRARELSGHLARALRADGGLCTQVTDGAAYARQDAARHEIRLTEEADHTALLRALAADGRPVDAVVHLGALHAAETADPAADPAAETGPRALLALARALADQPGGPCRTDLLYVTAGAQAVTAEDRPSPVHAMAGAVLKSLREELGGLRCVHLDLDPRDDRDAVPLLLAEVAGVPADTEVAHRDGHRLVRRLAPLPEPAPRTGPPAADGFHLVSGGLGGVGTEVAAHLLRTPGTRLLVLGRTPLPAPDTWPQHLAAGGARAARVEAWRRLRELGEVRYACADVGDERQVREAVRAAVEHWGVPLASVLHLAGSLVERPVGELDAAAWREALDAKVRGARTLHRVSADHPVTSFVTFSSVNGYFGGAMNAAYAAANAYLDGLALHRRASGLPGQSLAWSMWSERGMSSGYRLAPLTEARGYRVLDTTAALRSFDLARTLDEPHLLIGADRGAPWVRSHVTGPARQVRRLAGRVALEEGADLGALHRAAAEAAGDAPWVLRAAGGGQPAAPAGDADRLRTLEHRLTGLWRDVLGRDRVGPDENFFDLGGNSLLLVAAQSAVNRAFGCEIPVVDLFAHPTVRALARHLSALTGPQAADAPAAADPQAPPESAGAGTSGLDHAKERAQRQRAARARRAARHGKDRGHA